jgi:hypothetical protein
MAKDTSSSVRTRVLVEEGQEKLLILDSDDEPEGKSGVLYTRIACLLMPICNQIPLI